MFWSNEFSLDDLPTLEGRVFVITGGTGGIGLATAFGLASKQATIYISARSDEKGQQTVSQIKAKYPDAKIEYGIMDLTNLRSVRSFAEWFLNLAVPLHGLILNAGIAVPDPKLIDGIESQFMVNHLAHFYLVKLLLTKVIQSQPSRIVFVASSAHTFVKTRPDWKQVSETTYTSAMDGFSQYGYSKLANVQTAIMYSKLVQSEKVWINSLNPGAIASDIFKKVPLASTFVGGAVVGLFTFFLKSTDDGALTQIYCAASPQVEERDYRGTYFVPTAVQKDPTELALDSQSQQELWDFSESLLKKFS